MITCYHIFFPENFTHCPRRASSLQSSLQRLRGWRAKAKYSEVGMRQIDQIRRRCWSIDKHDETDWRFHVGVSMWEYRFLHLLVYTVYYSPYAPTPPLNQLIKNVEVNLVSIYTSVWFAGMRGHATNSKSGGSLEGFLRGEGKEISDGG
jgi:hypothetical protein